MTMHLDLIVETLIFVTIVAATWRRYWRASHLSSGAALCFPNG